MLFNSYLFLLVFLPCTVVSFRAAAERSPQAARRVLLLASAVFYGWWSVNFLALLIVLLILNFAAGTWLLQHRSRTMLGLGIIANLGVLGYFKYANFFLVTLTAGQLPTLLHIVLPLGISFFTFQKIAWLVDCYRRQCEQPDIESFALFVLFFPQLIAGPIVHARELLPQLAAIGKRVADDVFARGIFLLTMGLAKKVLIADTLALWVDPVFATTGQVGAWEAWTAVLAYTLQIYFDFSGYSEMAIGLALLFGLQLPVNFDAPYMSTSISDFWRRWHMTLSRFLRDYLYIPLGGSRSGPVRQAVALASTMLLGGLWHGADWAFVLWGAIHGIYLMIHKAWRRLGIALPDSIGRTITFLAIMIAWVPFRAADTEKTFTIWNAMLGANGYGLPTWLQGTGLSTGLVGWEAAAAILLLLAVWEWRFDTRPESAFSTNGRYLALTIVVMVFTLNSIGRPSSFIYRFF